MNPPNDSSNGQPGNYLPPQSPQGAYAPSPSPSNMPESANSAAAASGPQLNTHSGPSNLSQSRPPGNKSADMDNLNYSFGSMLSGKAENSSDEKSSVTLLEDLRNIVSRLTVQEKEALLEVLREDEDVKVKGKSEIPSELPDDLLESTKSLELLNGYFTKKQKKILKEKSLEKPVDNLAGIGKALKKRLNGQKYFTVREVYERVFLIPESGKNRTEVAFKEKMSKICEPRESGQQNINILQASWCYFCLYNWHQKYVLNNTETMLVHDLTK